MNNWYLSVGNKFSFYILMGSVSACAAIIVINLSSATQAYDYTFLETRGSMGTGDGQFNFPHSIAFDSEGTYMFQIPITTVQKFSADGRFIAKWGSEGQGDGQFVSPEGSDVDSARNVYVTDTGNSRIQKFSADGKFITKWGTLGMGEGNSPDIFMELHLTRPILFK